MQKATVNEISLDQCKKKFEAYDQQSDLKIKTGITEKFLCAEGKADTCQGLFDDFSIRFS